METIEARPVIARGNMHKDVVEGRGAAEEEDDDGGMEDYGEEEEEGEEGEEAVEEPEEEAEEEEEYPEEEVYPPEPKIAHGPLEDPYFMHGENLRNKFNEVELDSFMKLLNVKPYKQWQDESVHHYKLGAHTYEDDGQQLDPAFHILGEVERKYQEKVAVEAFRKGSEVKFEVG